MIRQLAAEIGSPTVGKTKLLGVIFGLPLTFVGAMAQSAVPPPGPPPAAATAAELAGLRAEVKAEVAAAKAQLRAAGATREQIHAIRAALRAKLAVGRH
jgi:hypothetical protein